MRYATGLGFHFSTVIWQMIALEWPTWIKCYTPSLPFREDSLVLDAGAGEGETLLFFYMLGFRRFRCVELNPARFRFLERNTQSLRDVHCELENRPFEASDVIGVDFAKIDVEGGETELLKVSRVELPKEIVLETHSSQIADALRKHLGGDMTYSMNNKGVNMWRVLNKQQYDSTVVNQQTKTPYIS